MQRPKLRPPPLGAPPCSAGAQGCCPPSATILAQSHFEFQCLGCCEALEWYSGVLLQLGLQMDKHRKRRIVKTKCGKGKRTTAQKKRSFAVKQPGNATWHYCSQRSRAAKELRGGAAWSRAEEVAARRAWSAEFRAASMEWRKRLASNSRVPALKASLNSRSRAGGSGPKLRELGEDFGGGGMRVLPRGG